MKQNNSIFISSFLLLLMTIITGCNKSETVLSEIPKSSNSEIEARNDLEEKPPLPPKNPTTPQLKLNAKTNAGENFTLESQQGMNLVDFGLKNYPIQLKDQNSQNTVTKTDKKIDANIVFFTNDPPRKVAEFFAPSITANKTISATKLTAVVGGITKNDSEVFIVATRINSRTQVSITASKDIP